MHALAAVAQPDSRATRLLVFVVCLAATLALAWEAARLTWLLWPMPETAAPPPRSSPGDDSPAAQSRFDTRALTSAHLFGEAVAGTVETRAAPIDAPDTTLNLSLRGILHNSDPEYSRALVQEGNGDTEVLAPGAEMAGGAILDAIYADRVILRRGDRHEALRLPEDRLASASAPPSLNEASAPTASEDRPEGRLSDLRQRLLNDPTALRQVLQPQPVHDEAGNLSGFRIRPGDSDLALRTGLRDGDVITEIAGNPLNSQSAAAAGMQNLGSAERVTLTVERDGRPLRILLDFRE